MSYILAMALLNHQLLLALLNHVLLLSLFQAALASRDLDSPNQLWRTCICNRVARKSLETLTIVASLLCKKCQSATVYIEEELKSASMEEKDGQHTFWFFRSLRSDIIGVNTLPDGLQHWFYILILDRNPQKFVTVMVVGVLIIGNQIGADQWWHSWHVLI